MSRATPYENRPPENWATLLEELSSKTFFLLSRNGPTVFKLKDEEDHLYKVMLGNPHTCTCDEFRVNKGYCIHFAYCILKVLRVDKANPMAFQTSYTDKDLDAVLSGRCSGLSSQSRETRRSNFRVTRASSLRNANNSDSEVEANNEETALQASSSSSPQQRPASLLKKPIFETQHKATRRELSAEEDDNICPICQDSMNDHTQALTWCRHGCGGNIHAKCMEIYSKHQISKTSSKTVHCPLCREDWNLASLKYDLDLGRVKERQNQAGNGNGEGGPDRSTVRCETISCNRCKSYIRSLFHRCVECSQMPTKGTSYDYDGSSHYNSHRFVDYCSDCFPDRVADKHQDHHFITSDANIEFINGVTWLPCKNRFGNATLLLSNPLISDLQNRDITSSDYDLLMSLDANQDVLFLSSVLVAALPKLSYSKLALMIQKQKASLPSSHRPNNAEAIVNQATSGLSDDLSGMKLCWCHNAAYQSLTTVELLCGHTAHAKCVQEDIEVIIREDISKLVDYRCAHASCGKHIFRCLQRKRRKPKSQTQPAPGQNPPQITSPTRTGLVIQGTVQQTGAHPNHPARPHHNLLPLTDTLRSLTARDPRGPASPGRPAAPIIIGGTRLHTGNSNPANNSDDEGLFYGSTSASSVRRLSVQSENSAATTGSHHSTRAPSRNTIRQRIQQFQQREAAIVNDPAFSSSILNVAAQNPPQEMMQAPPPAIADTTPTNYSLTLPKSQVKVGKLRPIGRLRDGKPVSRGANDAQSLAPLVTNIPVPLGIASMRENAAEIQQEAQASTASSSTNHLRRHTSNTVRATSEQRQRAIQQLENRFDVNLQLSVMSLQGTRNSTSQSQLGHPPPLQAAASGPVLLANNNIPANAIRKMGSFRRRFQGLSSSNNSNSNQTEEVMDLNSLMTVNHYN